MESKTLPREVHNARIAELKAEALSGKVTGLFVGGFTLDSDSPYPFCMSPTQCIAAGRCTRDPVCCE